MRDVSEDNKQFAEYVGSLLESLIRLKKSGSGDEPSFLSDMYREGLQETTAKITGLHSILKLNTSIDTSTKKALLELLGYMQEGIGREYVWLQLHEDLWADLMPEKLKDVENAETKE